MCVTTVFEVTFGFGVIVENVYFIRNVYLYLILTFTIQAGYPRCPTSRAKRKGLALLRLLSERSLCACLSEVMFDRLDLFAKQRRVI